MTSLLNCLVNYLFNVKCLKSKSASNVYSTGVPQGSVFKPLLLTLYTAALEKIAASYNLRIHQYADDTQLYGHCSFDASMDLQERMSKCIDESAAWLKANQMELSSKTEVIWFSPHRNTCKLPSQPVRVLNDHIISSDSVKNLGVYFDKDLSMKTHINKLLQMSFASLRKIRSIKNYLNQESLKTHVSALILSRVDYGNIVLMGLPKLQTQKIQSIINTPARLISGARKFDYITPVLKNLHWLKIEEFNKK